MNLLKALARVGSMTFLSRLLGFVRDVIIARIFGAGLVTDAFFVAFKIPNLLRRVFAEGAFSQAFVPILAEYRMRYTEDETRSLVDHVAGMLGFVLAFVSVAGVLLAPLIVYINAPGFVSDPEKFELTVSLVRVTIPYILMISLSSLLGAILNTCNVFTIPAITPALLNLSFILFSLFLAHWFHPPVMALAWAVIFGGIIQFFFQVPFIRAVGLMPRFRLNWHHSGMRRVMKQMGPAIFGVSVAQISILINTILASFLATGSVSWLYYADRLMEFPTGVMGVALGTILLPSLSKHYADASHEAYSDLLDWGIRLTLLFSLPAALALAILSKPLVISLFQYGHFSSFDALMSARAVLAYSVGLSGLIMIKVLAPGFYARQDIRTPVKIAVISLICTQLFNLVFIWHLKHAGLALSIGLGACVNALLLYRVLLKRKIYIPRPGWKRFILALGMALLMLGLFLWYVASPVSSWFGTSVEWRFGHLGFLVSGGALVYFGGLRMFGVNAKDFIKRAEK
ncbi:MAG: murein biosynthesis integral membrane protein MurJ [Pseudomonadota bacterium]|nr:murein biosynthesis integral membrane protein MurJ [Pseudomonadota bacterium]